MGVLDMIDTTMKIFNIDAPETIKPNNPTKAQVTHANTYNNNSTNNWLKMLTGKGGVLLIFAALYFWYRADNRKNIAFENEERRKEELHQAQLKKINKELEKEV